MKIFAMSTLVGAVAGVLGWAAAAVLRAALGAPSLESIPYGWSGLMVGMVSVLSIILIVAMDDYVDSIMLLAGAVSASAVMWYQDLVPLQDLARNTTTSYWVALAFLALAFATFVIGLRGARISAQRFR